MSTQHSSVQVVRAADLLEQSSDPYFAERIAGNTVSRFGLIPFGVGGLQLALAQTERGQAFPFQYHHGGGYEIAVILAGKGTIEVGEESSTRQRYPFARGDLVLIPPDVAYRVVNEQDGKKLVAWICFAASAASYWPDGKRVERGAAASAGPLLEVVPNKEIFLRHLPQLDLAGCPSPTANAARAAHNRQKLVHELWEAYQDDRQAQVALVQVIRQDLLSALWWCQHPYRETVALVRQMIEEKEQEQGRKEQGES